MRTSELKPFHVQQWVDSYPLLSQTSRRNYLRSMKRCLIWAKKQGYIDGNPIEHLEVPGAERQGGTQRRESWVGTTCEGGPP